MEKEKNIAFIDWQNLHLWTASDGWKIDFKRFRIYLKDKFKITEAYIFMWVTDAKYNSLYKNMQKAWFVIEFRFHHENLIWKKKWNVDVDIVFDIMKRVLDNQEEDFDKVLLVSWDWDYIKMVKYLIEKNKFKKILFPNKKYSSLYKSIKDLYWMNLSQERVRNVIKYK